MKNIILTTSFFAILLISTKGSAQDIEGYYIDGTKVDSINCWSFNELKIVFPVSDRENWKKYDAIFFEVVWNNKAGYLHYKKFLQRTRTDIDDVFTKGAKFGVYTFLKDPKKDYIHWNDSQYGYSRIDFGVTDEKSKLDGYSFQTEIVGGMIIGYTTDGYGNKTPSYSTTTLYKSNKIPVRREKKGFAMDKAKIIIDPCKPNGIKANFKTEPSGGYIEDLEIIKNK